MAVLLRYIVAIVGLSWISIAFSADNIVNVYTWAQEIPYFIIKKFEKETGIKVNYSTFDTNEAMFAKLRISKNNGYDVVEPSSYYIDHMRQLGMLEKLDKKRLLYLKDIDPIFLNPNYDPQNLYSIPFVWGATGIFLNKNYFNLHDINQFSDLFAKKFKNQVMFLDNAREIFSMALLMLGYSINDTNPEHIKQAYLKLKAIMPNVRLFNSDAVTSLLIDEDAPVGIVWNGDLVRAHHENTQLEFIYPRNGYEIWVDNFALMKNTLHRDNAYKFLNFIMRPDISKDVSMTISYSTANLAARNLMPDIVKNNPTLYPPVDILKRGEFQVDIGEKTLALYEKYWDQLKMGA